MEPVLQLVTAVVASTTSLALVFGGLAGWFVRRLDRRFDEQKADTHRQFDDLKAGTQREFDDLKADMQRQFDAAREERARLSTRLDAFGERQDALADQISDARHSLGRLEGIMLRTFEPEALAAPQQR